MPSKLSDYTFKKVGKAQKINRSLDISSKKVLKEAKVKSPKK